jgi:RNA polymerase sigma-70 factor, ECF subfamily
METPTTYQLLLCPGAIVGDQEVHRDRAAVSVETADAPRPSFPDVYAQHARFAWRSLRRLGVAPADVEDACQEVFLVIHRRLDDYDVSRPIKAWIFGVCLRVAAGYRRRRAARNERSYEESPEMAAGPEQRDALEHKEAQAILDGLLDKLTDAQRAVFVLFELEQLPMLEVAATVDCPLQTAYARLHAARKRVEADIQRLRRRTP